MDLLNAILNLVVPPAGMVMLAFAWPTLSFLHALEWFFKTLYRENMENKVVLITGASSAIGEVLSMIPYHCLSWFFTLASPVLYVFSS